MLTLPGKRSVVLRGSRETPRAIPNSSRLGRQRAIPVARWNGKSFRQAARVERLGRYIPVVDIELLPALVRAGTRVRLRRFVAATRVRVGCVWRV
jgi:hypothetical protein